ncbi:MAG TPA: terminase small subunit [Pseudolabrys sp.]|jgi:hypothetical protein
MPPLKNNRHERFALALAEGRSATEAYSQAGYKPCRQNAARLMTKDDIKARLAELQAVAAKKTEVTVESLLAELEQARIRADGLDQLSAAVKAISEKARISGLLVQKVEVGGPGDFAHCDSFADLADHMLREFPSSNFREITERDREGLAELLDRQASEAFAYLEAIQARRIAYGKSVVHNRV